VNVLEPDERTLAQASDLSSRTGPSGSAGSPFGEPLRGLRDKPGTARSGQARLPAALDG